MTISVKSSKPTIWKADGVLVAQAIDECLACEREAKALKTRAELAEQTLLTYCQDRWIKEFGSTGEAPSTPVKLANAKGNTVGYVVTDRSKGWKLSDEVVEGLGNLIGDEIVEEVTEVKPTFKFSEDVLDQTTSKGKPIREVVAERLQRMVADLAAKGQITDEQAGSLLEFHKPRVFKPYFLVHLPRYCGLNTETFTHVLNLIGSAVGRSIKA